MDFPEMNVANAGPAADATEVMCLAPLMSSANPPVKTVF